jgi:hypothetical protein
METFTEDIIDGINLALNEATILGIEFQKEKEIVTVTFSPVALDDNGEIPTDNRVKFVFKPVGKFIASYRLGRWDDKSAQVVKFDPEQIFEKVEEFKHLSIYGWEFINCKNENAWFDKLSFDFNSEKSQGRRNTIDLFQDGGNKHIDIKIWFDDFEIFNAKHEKIELQTFIVNGKRGWDGIYNGNSSDKFGIYPAK